MLGLTEKEVSSLTKLSESHPAVGKALKIMNLVHSDPSLRLYSALAHSIDKICDELYTMQTKNIIGSSPKEDKIFERINVLITKLPDYQKASKAGKETLKTLGLVAENEMESTNDGATWAAQMSKKHKER